MVTCQEKKGSCRLTIGNRLKQERLRLKFSQTDFGAIGGVTKKTQGIYEKDTRKPDAAYLTGIAHHVGADVQYILTGLHSKNLEELKELGESEYEAHSRMAREKKGKYTVQSPSSGKYRYDVTDRIVKIAGEREKKPDPLKLEPLRDLAQAAYLTDDQIKVIFELLEQASEEDFWIKK